MSPGSKAPPTRRVAVTSDGATTVCSQALLDTLLAHDSGLGCDARAADVSGVPVEPPGEPKTKVWDSGTPRPARPPAQRAASTAAAREAPTLLEQPERSAPRAQAPDAFQPALAHRHQRAVLACIGVIALGCGAAAAWSTPWSRTASPAAAGAAVLTHKAASATSSAAEHSETLPPSAAAPEPASSADRAVTTLAAASALSAGRRDQARSMYEALGRAQPEQPAFSVIARLLAQHSSACVATEGAPCR